MSSQFQEIHFLHAKGVIQVVAPDTLDFSRTDSMALFNENEFECLT